VSSFLIFFAGLIDNEDANYFSPISVISSSKDGEFMRRIGEFFVNSVTVTRSL
jgi:hypothetical protein